MRCSVDGCDGVVKARGLCWRHYQRLRRKGTTDLPTERSATHCHRGHEYTPDNMYTRKDGRRMCRACMRWRQQEQRRRERDDERAWGRQTTGSRDSTQGRQR